MKPGHDLLQGQTNKVRQRVCVCSRCFDIQQTFTKSVRPRNILCDPFPTCKQRSTFLGCRKSGLKASQGCQCAARWFVILRNHHACCCRQLRVTRPGPFAMQVADLHGVVSKARGFNKELKTTATRFLKLKLRPETGQWVKVIPRGATCSANTLPLLV